MAEKTAFEEVYEQNFKYVYNVVYMRVMHKETAEDITGDVFVKAWKNYERYDPEIASVLTWLCAIAVNEVKMYARKASTSREFASEELPETSTEDEAEVNTSAMAINREADRILRQLEDKDRELLSLRLAAELSFAEIAEILGTSQKAATERYRRLIIRCRKLTEARSMADFT